MLILTRRPLREAGRPAGRYRSAALALLHDGQIIGEVLVTEVVIDPFTGSVQVRLGFNLPADIHPVRADAEKRPQGPSHEWLVAREQCFDAPLATSRVAGPTNDRCDDHHDDPSASGAHYIYRAAGAAADRWWER